MLDIHTAEISGLPKEELGNVHRLHNHGDNHGRTHKAHHFVLLVGIAQNAKLPVHHAESTVGELLEVPAKHTGVELCAPEEVNDEIAVGARILGGGEVQALDDEKDTESDGENVHRGQKLPEVVVDDLGVDDSAVGQDCEGEDRNDIALESVRLVDRHMTRGGDGGSELLAWHDSHQDKLEGHVGQDDLPAVGVEWSGPDVHQSRVNPVGLELTEETGEGAAVDEAGVPKGEQHDGSEHHQQERTQGAVAEQPARTPSHFCHFTF